MSDFDTYAYVADGHERQQLDVFTPRHPEDCRTAVLILHGGGYIMGDRAAVHARCRTYAASGITAVAVGYRLLDSAQWPAQIDDVRAALRWTVEHAEKLGVDAQRIVLQGHSAGAHLGLVAVGAARADGEPTANAVVAYYGPSAMSLEPASGAMPAQMLLGPEATAEAAEAASPITYINADFPPTVLVHGAGDRFMPAVASMKLFEALSAAGVTAELHLIAGQDHEFDMTPRYNETTTDAVLGFLRAQVIEPELAEKEVREANPFISMDPPVPPSE